jgi:hypothetical protein
MESSGVSPQVLSAEELFLRYFLPLYPPEDRANLARLRQSDANPADNPHLWAQLDDIATTFARLAPALLEAPDVSLDFSDASVHRLAPRLTRERRDALLGPIAHSGEVPPLVNLVTHGAVYLGACIVRSHGARWLVRSPLWESLVRLESRAGVADLAPFQWWLKALSDEEVGEPRLADRYRLHVEVPTATPETLPVIVSSQRSLPRLTKVSYHALHQHLRAHLPELRDLGEHFPSAERFHEMGFGWLDFTLLGAGRMLLLHGPRAKGVHLLWLDATGFRAAAFYPADAPTDYRLGADADKLALEVSYVGAPVVHEMLWWGN